jgi:hypothetical protein
VEVVEGIARKVQIVFRHDAKCTNGRKCPAVFAVKLVDPIAVDDQFPRVPRRCR